ncbi:MAG: gluconate 2-dehydrogenase subunit 3 family protein [Pseudomonas sp.]
MLTADGALSAAALALLDAIAETIIPRTDTPGAHDIAAAEFIDMLFSEWMPAPVQAWFISGLEVFEKDVRSRSASGFLQMSATRRLACLYDVQATCRGQPARTEATFFLALKELMLLAYYTSEAGSSQELELNLVPGYYEPCKRISTDTHAQSIMRSTTLGWVP